MNILKYKRFNENSHIRKYGSKINFAIIDFLKKLKNEGKETSKAAYILKRYASGEKVSKQDMDIFRSQMISCIKLVGIGIPVALIPGSSLLLPLVLTIAKKYNVDILPKSFTK